MLDLLLLAGQEKKWMIAQNILLSGVEAGAPCLPPYCGQSPVTTPYLYCTLGWERWYPLLKEDMEFKSILAISVNKLIHTNMHKNFPFSFCWH